MFPAALQTTYLTMYQLTAFLSESGKQNKSLSYLLKATTAKSNKAKTVNLRNDCESKQQ